MVLSSVVWVISSMYQGLEKPNTASKNLFILSLCPYNYYMVKQLKFLPTHFDEEPKIFDNHAGSNGGGGGVFYFFKSEFNMLGGEIFGNKATSHGNDIYNSYAEGPIFADEAVGGY